MAMNDIKRYIWIMIRQLQLVSNKIEEFRTARDIDTITHNLLDIAGEIVGENRQGRTDTDYRTAIKYKIMLNNSYGEPETVILALKLFTNSTNVKYTEMYPAKLNMDFHCTTIPSNNLRELLEQISPTGVKIYLNWIPDGDYFACDGEGGYPPEAGTAGWNEEGAGNELTGGQLVEEI